MDTYIPPMNGIKPLTNHPSSPSAQSLEISSSQILQNFNNLYNIPPPFNYTLPSLSLNSNNIVDNSFNAVNSAHKSNNFNFYEELNKNDDEEENETDKCLISNMPLDKTKIEFECGHKFNYFYIFKETINSKKISYNVNSSEKLNHFSIKCPYCRTIYNKLLPPPLDISDTQEMNWINAPYKSTMPIKCNHEKCSSKKIYVTPLGYYCKPHYHYSKSGDTLDKNYEEDENEDNEIIDNLKIKIKSSGPELLHPVWKAYTHYKVNELKSILKSKGLKVSGTKPVLISRLLNNNIALVSYNIEFPESEYQWNITQ
jgi:hypothetical protein